MPGGKVHSKVQGEFLGLPGLHRIRLHQRPVSYREMEDGLQEFSVVQPRPKLTDLNDPARQATVETVASILKRKGPEVWSIAPEATVYAAIEQMASRGIGALVVLAKNRIAGIVSERDYARQVILRGRSSRETKVEEIMSSPVITAVPEYTVNTCLRIMNDRRIRHLPVVDSRGKLGGLVSVGDLVYSNLSTQAETIEELETYITNRYPR
jgi:CBS domain-containing protein